MPQPRRFVRFDRLIVSCRVVLLWSAALGAAGIARADQFAAVRYDGQSDELVVTMRYQGTNPNHRFSIQWGPCRRSSANPDLRLVAAAVTDDQWNDAAQDPFTTTVRFGLTDMPCRPAEVSLRTAPRYRYTIRIPAPPPPR